MKYKTISPIHYHVVVTRYIGNTTGRTACVKCVDAFKHFLLDTPQQLQALQRLWYHSITHQSALKDKTRGYQERMIKDLERWMREAKKTGDACDTVDENDFAMRHRSFIFGIVYMWLLNPGHVPAEKTFQNYLNNALKEISTRYDI